MQALRIIDDFVDLRGRQTQESNPPPRNYGEKLNYDPQWKGPLQIERKFTDLRFLVAMIIYFAIWISIGIFAFRTGEVNLTNIAFQLRYFYPIYSPALPIALGFTIFGFSLTFVYFFLLRYFPIVIFIISVFVNVTGMFIDIVISFDDIANSATPQLRFEQAYDFFVSCIVLLLTLIFFCVFYEKVFIACRVIKESTDAILFFPSSFLFPILPWTLWAISTVFAASTMLFLHKHPEADSEDGMPFLLFMFQMTNICAYLWFSNFLYAFSQMVLSGAFATWYWTLDRNQVPKSTMLKFMYITARFHLGTLAFGSLIITIVAIVRFIAWVNEKSTNKRNDRSATITCRCCGSLCEFTEDCLEYINTNAYIMCTMHGKKFIQSAKDAFNLLWRNIITVITVTAATMFILISGTLFAVGLPLFATYAYCQNMDRIVMYGALIIVFLTTSAITTSIFGVLNIAVHTIFLSVLEDYERNDGSVNRPYFMTHKLSKLLIKDEQNDA